jgi:biopolymer transport protein ExbB
MWVIIVCSALAAYIFLERLFHLHRSQISTKAFLEGIYNVLRRGNVVEAVTLCEDTPGPVANVVRAAVLKADDGLEAMARAIDHAGLTEIPRLEKNLVMLATMAKITPALGLLGTVFGMMQTLRALYANAPLAHSGDLAHGLWAALMTTAVGLIVAIPCYAGYNFLVSRVQALVLDMELAATDITTFMVKLQRDREKLNPS